MHRAICRHRHVSTSGSPCWRQNVKRCDADLSDPAGCANWCFYISICQLKSQFIDVKGVFLVARCFSRLTGISPADEIIRVPTSIVGTLMLSPLAWYMVHIVKADALQHLSVNATKAASQSDRCFIFVHFLIKRCWEVWANNRFSPGAFVVLQSKFSFSWGRLFHKCSIWYL